VNFGGVSINKSGAGEEVTLWKLDALSLQALKMLKVDVYVENDRKALSEDLITLISELGYDMWWHLPELYNPNNFAQNKVNVFARIVPVNLLCFPTEARRAETQDQRALGIRHRRGKILRPLLSGPLRATNGLSSWISPSWYQDRGGFCALHRSLIPVSGSPCRAVKLQ
jgi:hypothetical protein